jgi:1-acyl-sn-glycerol-3-phosphate acyltransferase
MRFIRSLLLLIYLVLFTVPYAIACFIAFPFMRADNRYWMAAGWCRATLYTVRWLNGIRYQVEGYENLPDGPAVLLSKHQSAWETLAFPALMPRPMCYVFKRELLFVPFFGWALGLLKMVHIDRKEGKYAFESVIKQGKARMDGRRVGHHVSGRHAYADRQAGQVQNRRCAFCNCHRRASRADRAQRRTTVAAQLVSQICGYSHSVDRQADRDDGAHAR